jgi:hypothetical protein
LRCAAITAVLPARWAPCCAQEGILKEHLEAAQKRADEALASATLEERLVMQAQQAQQAKALRKAQVRPAFIGAACVEAQREAGGWVGACAWFGPAAMELSGASPMEPMAACTRISGLPLLKPPPLCHPAALHHRESRFKQR